jgi:hypothetical protein
MPSFSVSSTGESTGGTLQVKMFPPTDFPVEETLKGCVLDMEDDLNLQCFTSGCLFNRGYSSKERELVLYSITYLYRLHDIRDVKLESLHGA